MATQIKLTFPALFNATLQRYGTSGAYAFAGEEPITYEAAYRKIQAVIAFLEKNNIYPGDKVAILSTNMPNWGIAYFSVTFMGAVAVPILPDFSSTEVGNVLSHSEAKAIFVSTSLLSKIEGYKSEYLKNILYWPGGDIGYYWEKFPEVQIDAFKALLKDILTREQMQKIYSCLNEIAENAEKKIKKDSGSLLKINGQSFRCNCGCNVFHQYEGYDDIFICNSCKIEYETK